MSNSSFSLDDFDNITNFSVAQTAHGFAVGDVLRTDGTNYAKAQADNDVNAEVAGIVSKVIDANTFKLRLVGRQVGLSGLVADTVYFLSHVTAGALTTTDPATISSGFVSKPVLLTDSTTSGMILTYRGINDGGGGDGGLTSLDGIGDVTITSPANGEVLTYDSGSGDWINSAAAGGGGGAWEYVSSTAVASQSSVDFTGLTSSFMYMLHFEDVYNTSSGNQMFLRTSTDNGSNFDSGGTDYRQATLGLSDSGSVQNRSGASSGVHLAGDQNAGSVSNLAISGTVIFSNPGNNYGKFQLNLWVAGDAVQGVASRWAGTLPIDAIRVVPEGGTLGGGTIHLYRLAQS